MAPTRPPGRAIQSQVQPAIEPAGEHRPGGHPHGRGQQAGLGGEHHQQDYTDQRHRDTRRGQRLADPVLRGLVQALRGGRLGLGAPNAAGSRPGRGPWAYWAPGWVLGPVGTGLAGYWA